MTKYIEGLLFTVLLIVLGVLAYGAAGSPALEIVPMASADKVVVCKYVTTPGEGEVLQTGQNPIVVSANSIPGFDPEDPQFPYSWGDQQGNSIAIRWAESQQDGDISECPGYVPPEDTPTPTNTPTEEDTPTSTPTNTYTPTPTEDPDSTPTPTATDDPSTETPTPTGTRAVPTDTPTPEPTFTPYHDGCTNPEGCKGSG